MLHIVWSKFLIEMSVVELGKVRSHPQCDCNCEAGQSFETAFECRAGKGLLTHVHLPSILDNFVI